ncbi:MAG: hypothetical protein AVDCRST_MAG27-2782, partial [uncultured Craurococcus sp.]
EPPAVLPAARRPAAAGRPCPGAWAGDGAPQPHPRDLHGGRAEDAPPAAARRQPGRAGPCRRLPRLPCPAGRRHAGPAAAAGPGLAPPHRQPRPGPFRSPARRHPRPAGRRPRPTSPLL